MRMRSRKAALPKVLFAGALAPALSFAGAAASAQVLADTSATTAGSLEGVTISAVEFSGNRSLAEETLLYYLGLEVGKPFSRATLDRNIKKLWDRQLIDGIHAEAVPDGRGGTRLVIRVEERPVVRSIEYQGLKRVARKDIDDKLASERISLHEGGPLNLGELHRIKSIIEELYAEKGYRFAQATYQLEPVGEGERRVVVTIDEGDRVRIGDIRFEGNTVYSEGRLRWQMKKTKESGPITRVLKKDIYNPASLEEDLDKVRDLYRKAGYKNVVLGTPRIQVMEEAPDQPGEDPKRRLVVTVPVEEGNRWRFGKVSVEGNQVFTSEGLVGVFRYRPGEWLRSSRVDEGVKAILEAYQNSGYIQARVSPELIETDNETADVVVHVLEADQYRVGRLEFEGNTRTRDKVLRREMRIQEGTLLSLGALKNSLLKIRQLGFFEVNEDEPIAFDFKENNTVDLTVKGKEADRTELQFAFGYQEGLGYFGQFAVKTQNFLGRGEQLGVSLQSGDNRNNFYEVSYFVPWFLDRPQSFGVQLFNRELGLDFINGTRQESRSRGASLTFGRSLGVFGAGRVSVSRFDQNFTERVRNTAGQLVEQSFEQEIFSLTPAYVYNTVDNPFEPKSGFNLTASVEWAGGALGGSENYYRPILSLRKYQPLTTYPLTTVGAFNLEGGLIKAVGDDDLSRFNLFRIGGESSVRGFTRSRLYARDPKTDKIIVDADGIPLGGDRYIQANLEYHLLLTGPFRLILFADSGAIFSPGQDFDLGQLRYTAGAELRISLPMLGGAPLRFIYAYNLDPKPDDEFKSFVFSIGTTF